MVYGSFDKLNAEYSKDRNDMDFEEEIAYVADCFDTYESLGFVSKFQSPYSENKAYCGMAFTVDGRVSYSAGEADIECLPMWHITLENGEHINAYPEEICKAEQSR